MGSAERAARGAGVEEVAGRVAPVSLRARHLLPVVAPLRPLLPDGGLRRGSVVAVTGSVGETSLAIALVAAASTSGSWVAVVGAPSLGLVAVAEAGVALERLALVPDPGERWATVAAALVDAVDVVVVRACHRVRAADARRLTARARERGAVLVALGTSWPEAPDVRLSAVAAEWHGLGEGHGHLEGRRLEVVAGGRGAAARERRTTVWLPAVGATYGKPEAENGRNGHLVHRAHSGGSSGGPPPPVPAPPRRRGGVEA